jgi:CRISPR system Cascade subunit CasA
MATSYSFDLWLKPWIPVETVNGLRQVSLRDALSNSQNFIGVNDSSPIITGGILRILIAIAQQIIHPEEPSDIVALWRNGKFPPDLIALFEANYKMRFDLFSPLFPFLQCVTQDIFPNIEDDTAYQASSPVARLCPDLPTGRYTTFRNHRHEDSYTFCPACAAKSLTSLAPFTTMGGVGYRKSINDVPPIYIFPEGNNLFQSLVLSLLLPEYLPEMRSREGDLAWWDRDPSIPAGYSNKKSIGYLHSLTFIPRRVRLYPEKIYATCSRCGNKTEIGIRRIYYSPGESVDPKIPKWQDPFVGFRVKKDGNTLYPIKPGLSCTWGNLVQTVLPNENVIPPSVVSQILVTGLEPKQFRFIGLVTNQAKFISWFDEMVPINAAIFTNQESLNSLSQSTRFADNCIYTAIRTLRSFCDIDITEFSQTLWSNLYEHFSRLQLSALSKADRARWINAVIGTITDGVFQYMGTLPWSLKSPVELRLQKTLKNFARKVYPDIIPGDENDEYVKSRSDSVSKAIQSLNPGQVKELAELLGQTPDLNEDFTNQLLSPFEQKDKLYAWITITLACAVHKKQIDGVDIGEAARRVNINHQVLDSILSIQSAPELAKQLSGILSTTPGCDWNLLAQDLRFWNATNKHIQRRWARSYFSNKK